MLRAAPWTRAPWLTLRLSPGSFFACVLAGVVLCAAAASGPLFLASTATAALHNEAAQACPEASRPAITDDAGAAAYPTAVEASARLTSSDTQVRAAARTAGLRDPYRVSTATVPAATATAAPADGSPAGTAFLFSRAGSPAHVTVVAGRAGGLLVPATYAATAHVGVGSELRLGSARARIDGIYRDLSPSAFVPLFRLPAYWCTWTDAIVPTPFDRPPPMFLVADPVLIAAGVDVTSNWYDPTPIRSRTVAQAATAVSAARAAAGRLNPSEFRFSSELPAELTKTARVRQGVRGPVVPVVIASVVLAGLLVMAGGTFWGVRRQREIRLLSARGAGPAAIGLKAALELLPALALGCLLGWLLALQVVGRVGPSSLFEPGAPAQALRSAAAAAAGGVALVAFAGARSVRPDRRQGRRRWVRFVPWELLLAAAAVICFCKIRRDGAIGLSGATVQINPLVTAYPLLALAAAVLIVGRGTTLALPSLRWLQPRSNAGYLAARRLARTPTVTVGVLIAVAFPVAIFTYSVALSGSTQRDVAAKYRADIGAPQAIGLLTHGHDPRPGRFGTVVGLIDSGVQTQAGTDVAVLGVDPATLSRFAFGGNALRPTLRALEEHRPGAAAVVVNAHGAPEPRSLVIGGTTLRVTVVAARSTFPGLRDPYRPLIVVDRRFLPAASALIDRSDELWTTARGMTPALNRLRQDGVEANYAISPTTFLDSSGLRPVTWVFGYLRAVALMTAAIGLAGLAYGYAARTRARARAYHLARRMGLSRAAHRRSLFVELLAVVGTSWLVGSVLAVGAIESVYRLTDTYPAFPPPPRFPSVSGPLVVTAVAAVVAVVVATLALQHLADRIRAASLLRA